MFSARSYGKEVCKCFGVDCHAAFLGHGKFLAIKAQLLQKAREKRTEDLKRAEYAIVAAESLEDDDYPSTVADANEARQELAKVKSEVASLASDLVVNSKNRAKLKTEFEDVGVFLRECASSPAGDGVLTVETLPMTEQHLVSSSNLHPGSQCCDVNDIAEFREKRALAHPTRNILESLAAFEEDFEERYRRDHSANVQRRSTEHLARFWARIAD